MAWRGLHISQPCRLSLAERQCVVAGDSGEVRVPVEDLAWIVLDTPQAVLTSALLGALSGAGVALVTTDLRHLPNGVLHAFHTHHRQAAVAANQVALSQAVRDRLWLAIVRAKILGQASVLLVRGADAAPLTAMIQRVRRGDPDNVEARAARYYWGRLFDDFMRGDEGDLRNGMLDYGYAVMRAAVARAVVAVGLLPSIGLHHRSALNGFNLVDDLMEPFRPIVDLLVWRLSEGGRCRDGALTLGHRRALAAVLVETVRLGSARVTALVASEMAGASLARAIEGGGAAALDLPGPETG